MTEWNVRQGMSRPEDVQVIPGQMAPAGTIPSLSDAWGTTVPQLQTNIRDNYTDDVESLDKAEEMQLNLERAPAAQRMYRDPETAKAGAEETGVWAGIEDIGQGIGNAISRSWTGAIRGYNTHELGIAGSEARSFKSEESKQRIADIKERLEGLGAPTENGFTSYLEAASEILGQQYASWTSEEAAERLAAGMAVGAALGAGAAAPTGGAIAPITVTGGALVGAGGGAITHMILDSFEVEGGLAYVDMTEMGIEEHIAAPLSIGVGVLNSGLELIGATGVLKPMSETAKAVMRKAIRKTVMKEGIQKLIKDATLMYGKGIFTEVTTEVIQEIVNIGAEEIGKAFSDADFDSITEKEMSDRLTSVMEKTFKAMVLLGMPGAGAYVAVNIQDAKQAGIYQKELDALKAKLDESSMTVEQKSKMVGEIMKENNAESVYIPSEFLQEWIELDQDPESLANVLGVTGTLENSVEYGLDVEIDAERFAQYIVQSDRFEFINDHIKITEHGMTAAEAKEYMESGVQLDLGKLNEGMVDTEQDSSIVLAEEQLGLKAMFTSADEAGMTAKQYEKYLADIENTKTERAKHMADLILKQEQKENTSQWQKALQEMEAVVGEQYSQSQTYGAMHGVGANRLNKAQMQEIADELGISLKDLPKIDGMAIYETNKDVEGFDAELHADAYGYDDVYEFVEDMATAVPLKDAIKMEVDKRMTAEHGTLLSQRNRIIEARKAVQSTTTMSILTEELNALRTATQQKRLKPSIVRSAAKERMRAYNVSEVNPTMFEKAAAKAGRKAGQAQRAGNIGEASDFKFKQVVNTEMARQAYEARASVDKKREAMLQLTREKGTRKIGGQTVDDIRQILANVNLTNGKAKPLKIRDVHSEDVDPVYIPEVYRDSAEKIDYKDMTLEDFETLHELVQEIAHKGRQAGKLRDQAEKRSMERIAQLVSAQIKRALGKKGKRDLRDEQNNWKIAGKDYKDIAGYIYNADTILREMDEFADLGIVYQNIKGRYDRAMSTGYRDDQDGFLRRQQVEAKALAEIFDNHFTLSQQKKFSKKLKIKGLQKKVSRHTMLSILLNSGNAQNLNALNTSGIYTEQELALIKEAATKQDWEFAQAIWDYLDSFWDEVNTAEINRRNSRPKKVKAQAIKTKYGTFKGGYYPIRWQGSESVFFSEKDMNALADGVKYGKFVSSHTARGHTLTRTEGKDKALDLNLFVIHSHIDQLTYDLEMGDALNDAYKVLYNKDVKKAIIETGNRHKWDQLDFWFRDVIKGEVGASGGLERLIHNIRTGVTVSKLGWNVGVAALQPLGLLQTAVVVGKTDTLSSLVHYMVSPLQMTNFAREKSGMMASRHKTHQADINDASKALAKSWFSNALPGKTGQYIQDTFFFFIRAMQGVVDSISWNAGYRKGLKKFGNEADAIQYADRVVTQSQASGILGDRTPLERGTVGQGVQQKESIKMFMNFMSYFMSKANIAISQYKKTNFANPLEFTNFVINMGMIFTVEAFAAALIRNQLDEDEPLLTQAAELTGYTVLGSIPGGSMLSAEFQGFRGGSAITTTAKEVGQLFTQVKQGEWDQGLAMNALDVLGIWKKLPTGQIKKTLSAKAKAEEGYDVHWSEYLLGPQYGK